MPELPEVETVRRGLSPFMAGCVLKDVTVRRAGLRVPFPMGMAEDLNGRKSRKLTRRAKYLLIHFEGVGRNLMVVHLGMSGRMTIVPDIASYEAVRHDHMIMSMDSGTGVVFNDPRRFGMVLLMEEAAMPLHPSFAALGPEPFAETFDGKILHGRIGKKAVPVKLALLDQRVVAGVGNIYACEALYEAGIAPDRLCGNLSAKHSVKVADAVMGVLARAIEAGGSSLKDYRQADGNLGYFQHSFKVYGRAGEAYQKAGANDKKKHTIQKMTQGGRTTFYCPACQK